MKKLFAILAVMGVMTLGSIQPMMAQEEAAAAETAVVEEGGIHKEIKTKYIEGGADFMSLVSIALVIGLAFCIERFVKLSLAEVKTK